VHFVALVAEHWPQAPVDWQAGVAPPQSVSPAHARHRWVVVLQTGVVPPHSAFVLQLAHKPTATLQTGIIPEHFVLLVAEQTPHAPVGWQAGVAPPPQSVSPVQARQVWVVVLQTGVVPPHSALETHGTHVPLVVLQTGVAAVHFVALALEHWPQAPPGWQAGVAPPQSVSPAQAWQVWNAGSQTGVAPEQSLLTRQVTQVPVVV
jgi:hypothetical protein